MFESAELGHEIDKTTYDKIEPKLRAELLETQLAVVEAAKFPVIILSGGVDGGGKGATVNLLNEWMDARHIRAHAMDTPTDEEKERPPMWRFWRKLPPKGTIGIFFGSWYTDPIVLRAYGKTREAELDRSLDEILRFERMLADEGALIVKFWFHLSKKKQKKRFEELESDKDTRWQVTKQDWANHKHYDVFRTVSEHALRRTSTAHAPWVVVEGWDHRYRSVTVAQVLRDAMKKRLEEGEKRARPHAPPTRESADHKDVLAALDLGKKVSEKEYDKKLVKLQSRLALQTRDGALKGRAMMLVFEGNDAAGKGGSIRRITRALDARHYDVIPIAAPTEEERAQPYLWRFWRHVPRLGKVAIFDRSWYGRVLVERVEGFAPEADWTRAYEEINDFEDRLVRHGIVVLKFWLSISKEEQLARFKSREHVAFKHFKITKEDWRNRGKWEDYARAACDMIDRTSTEQAPWVLVEANDKHYARIKILKTVCDRLDADR